MAANRKSLCGRHRPFHRLTAVMWFRWVHSRAKQMRMHWRRRSAPGSLEEMVSGRSALDLIKRSEEHTSELQSLMRISYAVFCLKKKKQNNTTSANTLNNVLMQRIKQTHYYTSQSK